MWIKLDDGFATHPKILQAGILALGIQVRAICYSSKYKTDGFIPSAVVSHLLEGLERIGIDTATIGDYAAMGTNADEIDWAAVMVSHHLWDVTEGGYIVHDYLDWNISKKDYESFIKKKSVAGKKGMKARWGKGLRKLTPAITDDITKSYHPTSTSTLTSLPLQTSDLKSNGHAREYREEAKIILAFLNEKVGKHFREVDVNLDLIVARLKSGVEVQTCKTLIARKVRDWKTDATMSKYLRPETLFNKTKFETYLAEVSS